MSMPITHIRSMALYSLPLVLLVVLTSIVIWQLTKSEPLPTGRRLAVHQALQNLPTTDIEKRLAELLPEDMFAGRDPFFRSSAPQTLTLSTTEALTSSHQEMYLTTIAHGKLGRYCLINGNIYHEGQKGDGFTVQDIKPDHVMLSTPVQTLRLLPGRKITLESGKVLIRDDKMEKTGINSQSNANN